MGKDSRQIYRHSQSQLSTTSIKTHILSFLYYQTSTSIELTTTFVPSVIDKTQTNYVLCSKNSIHNYVSITNNDNMRSYETQRKKIIALQPLQLQIILHKVFLPHQ